MSFRRIPKEIDPRRPPKRKGAGESDAGRSAEAQSYGQYVDVTKDDLDELESVTDEVAREGSASIDSGDEESRTKRRSVEDREAFEDATDEVSREGGQSRSGT